MKNTTWTRLVPGEIVSFIYKSKGEPLARRRWVIVIDPKWIRPTKEGVKRYFVGLQLHQQGKRPVMKPVIQKVIKLLGGLAVIEDKAGRSIGKQVNVEIANLSESGAKNMTPGEFTKLFNRMRRVIGTQDIFRTYDMKQCRRRRVFLDEDYGKIPAQSIKRLETQIKIGTEVVVED
jgi:hypothetical protein